MIVFLKMMILYKTIFPYNFKNSSTSAFRDFDKDQ